MTVSSLPTTVSPSPGRNQLTCCSGRLRYGKHPLYDGTALTADDVKFSIDSVLDPKAVGLLGPRAGGFLEVEVKDAVTVVIPFHRPVIFLPWIFPPPPGAKA